MPITPKETVLNLAPDQRSLTLTGVPADGKYRVEIEAFRVVDQDVDADGVIESTVVVAPASPYQPSPTVKLGDGVLSGSTPIRTVVDASKDANGRVVPITEILGSVGNLKTVYGDTVSSKANADAAAASQAVAQTAASNASTALNDSKTARDAAAASAALALTNSNTATTAKNDAQTALSSTQTALTNANAAKTAAETARTASQTAQTASEAAKTLSQTAQTAAQTAATNASTSATTASTSATNAKLAGAALLPSDFSNKGLFWQTGSSGAPGSVASPADALFTAVAGVGTVYNINGTFQIIAAMGAFKPVAGRTYDVEAGVKVLSDNTAGGNSNTTLQFVGLNESYVENAYVSGAVAGFPASQNNRPTDANFVVWKARYVTAATPASAWLRPRFYSNYNGGTGASGNQNVQLSYLKVTDVTDVLAAAGSATAAAGSASTATTQATAAGSSATSATGSANTATTKAQNASDSATAASTSASAASGSASSAGTSASAAQTSATTASTKAGEASTSATNSAGSASDASGSKTAAAASATQAANSATAAGGSATAANTSAGSASTSATNAGNSASAANTSAVSAASKASDAAGSATQANNSATAAAGSASTASTQATAAGNSASSATTSANTATSKAADATTAANNAAGSATAANTSAGSASTSATAAGNSATAANASAVNAASSYTAANQTVAATLPSDFALDGRFFKVGYSGDPATSTPIGAGTGAFSFATVTGVGRLIQVTSATANVDFATLGMINLVANRKYKVTSSVRLTAGANGTVTTGLWGLGNSATYGNVYNTSTSIVPTTSWQTLTCLVDANTLIANGAAWLQPMVRSNATATNVFQYQFLKVEDVTESTNAGTSATAAAGSASSASTSATNAGTSATAANTSATNAATSAGNAQTYQNNASTSASNAAGSATSATNQAGVATTAANNAAGSATAASGSAGSASTSATAAGNSATAANASATNAATSAGNASTSASQASTSATNAAGSANSATTQANVAATSATAANTTATNLHPTTFESGGTFFAGDAGAATPNGVFADLNGVQAFQNSSSTVVGIIAWKTCVANKPGKWKVRAKVGNSQGAVSSVELRLAGYTVQAPTTGRVGFLSAQRATPADGTIWVEATFDAPDATAQPWVKPEIVLAYPGTPATVVRCVALELIDVTESTNAATAATAAAGSASTASTKASDASNSASAANTSATNAATSAGNASTSASNASTSASNASGSANTATSQATLASTAKTAAETAKSGADTAKTAAETAKTAAASSASAANTSAGQASTSATNAGTSASAANTSAIAASASKDAASGSASNAAGSATTASAKADAASGSASTANTAASNAASYRDAASTSASNAQTSANTATSAAATATSQATIASSYSGASAVKNDQFANWPDANGLPAYWTLWAANGYWSTSRNAEGVSSNSPYSVYATQNYFDASGGWQQTVRVYPGKWVMEATTYLSAGTNNGAGVHLNVNGQGFYMHFATEPDTYGVVSNNDSSRLRTWSKMIDVTSNSDTSYIYMMTNWSGFGSTATKSMYWYNVRLRPANAGEILSGVADAKGTANTAAIATLSSTTAAADAAAATRIDGVVANVGSLTSTVSTQAGAIADINGRTQAYWQTTANAAANATAFIQAKATSADGVSNSTVAMGAKEIHLYNQVDGGFKKALSVVGGNAELSGGLSANTYIRLGSGAQWNVALRQQDFAVYDGQVVNFGTNLGNLPQLSFAGNNLAALSSGQTYSLYAENLTTTGFTARLRIITPSAPANFALGPGVNPGSGPTFQIDKGANPDSQNGTYNLSFNLNVSMSPSGIEDYR